MRAGFIRRRLRIRRLWLLAVVFILSVIFVPGLVFSVSVVTDSLRRDRLEGVWAGLMTIAAYAGCAGPLFIQLWRLRRIDQHPDLVELTRYGPLAKLIPEIEREVVSKEEVVSIGRPLRAILPYTPGMASLNLTRVVLTKSWLIHFRGEGGYRMSFLRLANILVAHRPIHPTTGMAMDHVVFIDDVGVKVTVYGKYLDLTRLLVHLLPRIPWALTRFGEAEKRVWQQERGIFLAELDERREHFRRDGSEITSPPP